MWVYHGDYIYWSLHCDDEFGSVDSPFSYEYTYI